MTYVAEYIWLGGSGELRSKTRVLEFKEDPVIPEWSYDGSSTGQAPGKSSEITLKPVAVYNCPFRGSPNVMVMCCGYDIDGCPVNVNYYDTALDIFQKHKDQKPWFGIEQEFYFIQHNPAESTKFYCGVRSRDPKERLVVEQHLAMCLQAGLEISGINPEVGKGQWEYQIGPVEGIEAANQLWISRFILERLSETYDLPITWEPKPYPEMNGSGCHVNFSTDNMRNGTHESSGYNHILEAITKLSIKHKEHMEVYGEDNKKRLTGSNETEKYDTFSYGIADRESSIRIGNTVYEEGCGYFEDRRPASNMDPYLVTAKICETVCN